MKWENLSRLVQSSQDDINGYGHFMSELKVGFDFRQ